MKGSKNSKIVYAYVVADMLHVGHLYFLQKAKKLGYLIVGVLTDKATMEKKPKPVIPYRQRLEIVRALDCVDEAVPQYTYSPLGNVKKIQPDILIESNSHKEYPANDYVKSYGGITVVLPYYSRQSSTAIKKSIIGRAEELVDFFNPKD